MASNHSFSSAPSISSPEASYGSIHRTNTAGLSMLLDPPSHTPTPNPHAILDTYGTPPSRWSSLSPPSSPSYSPPSPSPPPPRRRAPRPHPFPQQWQFVPYPPIDEDALEEHNPFLLAEEWGGHRICDRGCLYWIEGRRLPSLVELGLDGYARLGRSVGMGRRSRGAGRSFWDVVL